ncbi:hypothetical protein Wildcat_135 [Mycobacterium phage Wildcat]|uniref:Uncharacterized protein n=3 Tax=Mycobacterium virus Wildcat TaxID=1993859 RepID=Q19XU9_9CAUD|nr:hypothetical protein Wildcat_135 [Mycobacterium phage Wildcat]ABE67715.1 hypothetical protein Wildcat_135 [Mycobacterium phage Wildcat]AJD82183.1 hypothetical protein COSMO_136 [Mycobacterium phage Cosmo]QGJ89996.1 hypothetical protein PBI_MARYV_121 [Mycobacterium phage MaryV]WKR36117.1 hypothetical protein [Mycobacterium phage Azrael100]
MSQSKAPGETPRRTHNQCRIVVTLFAESDNPLPFGTDVMDVARKLIHDNMEVSELFSLPGISITGTDIQVSK